MKQITLLLAGLALLCGAASADTIVQLGTEYQGHSIKEGYAGDIDQMQNDVLTRRSTLGNLSLAPRQAGANDRHPVYHYDITVSDVRASVYSDNDRDGYFTHFSLNFDVDTRYGYEYVYAKIYLRKDNSDYSLFHVTEVFEIYSDLNSDRYKVDSKLVSNFDAAYYDVRIEILIAGKTGVQDVVDAQTHRSLFALPLEADRLDGNGNSDIIVHEHGGGSFSLPALLVLALAGIFGKLLRRRSMSPE